MLLLSGIALLAASFIPAYSIAWNSLPFYLTLVLIIVWLSKNSAAVPSPSLSEKDMVGWSWMIQNVLVCLRGSTVPEQIIIIITIICSVPTGKVRRH